MKHNCSVLQRRTNSNNVDNDIIIKLRSLASSVDS
ncbi:Uncharacterized protein APZ42_029683 [Daphnia magna]|uniref:Uncharacterized protein n=1 Tax=Daphnia magna TaxID=35525 RepID=A0A164PEB3_9CRUS|nr:Uncharacterized protein APZ42_029683 [Daphnia magna]